MFVPDEGFQVCTRCGRVGERIPVVAFPAETPAHERIDATAFEAVREVRLAGVEEPRSVAVPIAHLGGPGLAVAIDDLAPVTAAPEPAPELERDPDPPPASAAEPPAETPPADMPSTAGGLAPVTVAVIVVGGVLLCGGLLAFRHRRARFARR